MLYVAAVILLQGISGCGSDSKHSSNTIYLNYSSGTLESIDPAFAKNLYNMWTDHMVYNHRLQKAGM
jgi:hypothetical protein